MAFSISSFPRFNGTVTIPQHALNTLFRILKCIYNYTVIYAVSAYSDIQVLHIKQESYHDDKTFLEDRLYGVRFRRSRYRCGRGA